MKQQNNRGRLRRQLKEAWRDTMSGPYLDQAINSERALQVHLAARLMNAFGEWGARRQLFIEPMVSVNGGENRLHPDILICNTREVIGIVELKYQPRTRPSYTKDFRSLESLHWDADQIEIVNGRYRGPNRGGTCFAISGSPLFVWAGVYAAPYRTIPEQPPSDGIASNLLVLHAVTQSDDPPDLHAGTKRL
ncbi:hypothetical protein G4Y73_09020 [Wenzhouxiangella sp. XN201]|uniref:hypothetical protein n=1 Tax=Wenzhouxiangella sp. XN201 TaxID=2710755 RepID=UPI0013CA9D6C|nr:hypothetical protein [Wenzhouxiangella sp. XN201]NEZ04284.1 hypothetical protein [Wenzhouxiangella sp. XN201]